MARASAGAGRTAAPRRSRTRILLPAPFMRAIGAPGQRMAGDQAVSLPSRPAALRRREARPAGRSPARRAARPPRAGPRPRFARRPPRAPRLRPPRTGAGARRVSLERRQRTLAEGDLLDAAPAEMGVDPRDDDRGAVLRLEREGAVDPEHQRRGLRPALRGRALAARGGHCSWIGRAWRARSRRRSPANRRSGSPRSCRARPAPSR